MSGIKRLLIGEIPTNLRGEAYKKAMQEKLSPESMANCDYDGDMDNSTTPDKKEDHKEYY